MYHGKTIGVVIPAHNEALSIGLVVRELAGLGTIVDKIVVCDNASADATAALARTAGAVVVSEPDKGYGAACLRAMTELADVDCIVFVDGDHSMRADELPRLLDAWRRGGQLVIGSRSLGAAKGLMEHGSLTPHQRWGNTLASFLLTCLWQTPVTDLGPFRAIGTSHLAALDMRERTFGWTVEMQAKALATGLRVIEVPVASTRRIGVSKVSGTWRGSLGASIGILTTIGKIGGRAVLTRLFRGPGEATKNPSPIDT